MYLKKVAAYPDPDDGRIECYKKFHKYLAPNAIYSYEYCSLHNRWDRLTIGVDWTCVFDSHHTTHQHLSQLRQECIARENLIDWMVGVKHLEMCSEDIRLHSDIIKVIYGIIAR